MAAAVHLGFKLPLGWRAYAEGGHLPQPASDLHASLSDAGFVFFEVSTSTLRAEAERDMLRGEAASCAAAGLRIALHPYTKGAENPAAFGLSGEAQAAMVAMLRGAGEAGGAMQQSVPMVLHPAEAKHEPPEGLFGDYRRRLLGRSRAYFTVLAEFCATEFGAVRPAVEFQMPTDEGSPVIRIGDTSDELLEASAGLPLCLDVGHYLLSVDRYGLPPVPPDALLRRVEAVHLHDVVDGRDHRILTARSGRARACIEALLGVGYGGNVTLEYSMAAIRDAGNFESVIAQSNEALATWLA